MKKLALLAIMASCSFSAMATSACAASTTGSGTAVADSTTAFIKVGFTPKCSANTYVDFVDTNSRVGVGAVSTKGKNIFSGHSEGGAVKASATPCSGSTCAGTEAATAATAASTAS